MGSLVLAGAQHVASVAQHVSISQPGVRSLAQRLAATQLSKLTSPAAFDSELHYAGPSELMTQYLLVVDALNFCFWPEPGLEYEHLAQGLKAVAQRSPEALSAASLAGADEALVSSFFQWPGTVPLLQQRVRLVREVGQGLQQGYNGSAAELVKVCKSLCDYANVNVCSTLYISCTAAAKESAVQLVRLVVEAFPGFRDEAAYRGHTVRLYKRAQIFVGDVWGAFQGQGLGTFHDIDQLTMFADYRVPVVLREAGVLQYSPSLAARVDSRQELPAGSEEEVEIRACTIVAVEDLRAALAPLADGHKITSVQLDWCLWEEGERNRRGQAGHHCTLTHFY